MQAAVDGAGRHDGRRVVFVAAPDAATDKDAERAEEHEPEQHAAADVQQRHLQLRGFLTEHVSYKRTEYSLSISHEVPRGAAGRHRVKRAPGWHTFALGIVRRVDCQVELHKVAAVVCPERHAVCARVVQLRLAYKVHIQARLVLHIRTPNP